MKNNLHIVFDLDDTLYKERDYVKSAYNKIKEYLFNNYEIDISNSVITCLNKNKNLFDFLHKKDIVDNDQLSLKTFLNIYRNHKPSIFLDTKTHNFLNHLKEMKISSSLITDGRSITQRNKIESLGLTNYFKKIIISDEVGYVKPNLYSFQTIQSENNKHNFMYVGDNTEKDFFAPNQLGWKTVCILNDGRNIHQQDFELKKEFLPKYKINDIIELKKLI